ncbi:MAG: GNAT family N-acetyltransferase [Sciscionella sp.]
MIRPATVEDVTQIAEVHVRGWQVGYRGLLPQPLLDGLRPGDREPRWATTVRNSCLPDRGVLVAVAAARVVGFANLRPTRDEDQDPTEVGEITSFYVLPTVWGRGVGHALMAAAERTLHAGGFSFATLWVLQGNLRAMRFYTHAGWVPDGIVKDDAVGGAAIRDLRYRRELR